MNRNIFTSLTSARLGASPARQRGERPAFRALLGAAWLLIPGLVAAQDFNLDWFGVAAGGGTSSGGDFALTATIGQPAAGALTGGDFVLEGGFWSVAAVVESVGAPTLTLSLGAGSLLISWPAAGGAGFHLEETTVLSNPSAWTTVNTSLQTSNGTVSALLPLNPGDRYYRLHKP